MVGILSNRRKLFFYPPTLPAIDPTVCEWGSMTMPVRTRTPLTRLVNSLNIFSDMYRGTNVFADVYHGNYYIWVMNIV